MSFLKASRALVSFIRSGVKGSENGKNQPSEKQIVAVFGPKTAAKAIADNISAADVLAISRKGPKFAERQGPIGHVKFTGRKSFAANNASTLILNANPGSAIWSKDSFSRKQWLLVAMKPWLIFLLPALIRHMDRKRLIPHGKTTLNGVRFLCFRIECDVLDNHRQYYPLDTTPRQFLKTLQGLNYVLLRDENQLDALKPGSDIDLLAHADDIPLIVEKNAVTLCTRPMDMYSHDGSNGFYFNRAPAVTPNLAESLLKQKVHQNGIQVPAPSVQFLSDQFHLMFHGKSRTVPPGTEILRAQDLKSANTFPRLQTSAKAAGQDMPQTYSEIEDSLRAAEMFPEIDLLGFYCVKNPFLQHRYLSSQYKAGLATFFIRDFGIAPPAVDKIRDALGEAFSIILETPLTGNNLEKATNAIRGGNWADPEADGGIAKPVYLFVCIDPAPQKPSRRTKRKHPLVDNGNNRIKEEIRKAAAPERRKALRMIHGSDNTNEAVAHLQSLDLLHQQEVQPHIEALTIKR